MRALITGGLGFVGRQLAQHLVSCGDDVAVTYKPEEGKSVQDLIDGSPKATSFTGIPRSVQTFGLDIVDGDSVSQLLKLAQPDTLYHLAAISSVHLAEKDKKSVVDVNVFGTLNILEAVKEFSPNTKILFVSSSEVYGEPRPGSLPLTEMSELRPANIYGWSKAAADMAAFKSAYRDRTHVVRVRPFNHIGPGQSDVFSVSSFAKQVAAIKLKQAEPVIEVGNLDPKRDFCDVGDIVRGYREALLNGKPAEVYNLCSGQSHQMKQILDLIIKRSGIEVEVKVDPARVRPVEVTEIVGSFQRAQKDLGWKPRVELEASIDTVLAYWMEALS